ncbi:amidophosphoribosyltransferase [Candidatus Saccharibacteria bacterium]|nr:MAG: amidophosphoribosyltransferase [Candidatus Saccharibacteria bacterium]
MTREGVPVATEFVEPLFPCVETDDKPQDECGVMAVYLDPSQTNASGVLYQGLRGLQHRGQSGAGIAVADTISRYVDVPAGRTPLIVHKNNGLVDEAIGTEVFPLPNGSTRLDEGYRPNVGIGHVRYSTAESDSNAATQPFVGVKTGIALAHNGHVDDISRVAALYGITAEGTASDSALLTRVIDTRADALGSVRQSLLEVLPNIEGAYCLTVTDGKRIFAARDPWGFHPLALGKFEDERGYVVASESVIFDSVGAAFVRDIEPGEIVVADETGVTSLQMARQEATKRCMFEYIYTARPDGVIDNRSVYRARKNLGRSLAEDYPVDADVVVGVPSSGLAAATGFSEVSGLPRVDGIFKNAYIGRTFIERGDRRKQTLSEKFQMNREELAGRRIVLVDDSLIKGNTMKQLVSMLRDAGTAEVHVRLSAPRYENPCLMGMDTHDVGKLIARTHTDVEIAAIIGADSVAFNDINRAMEAIDNATVDPRLSQQLGAFCTACASGQYPITLGPDIVGLGIPKVRS